MHLLLYSPGNLWAQSEIYKPMVPNHYVQWWQYIWQKIMYDTKQYASFYLQTVLSHVIKTYRPDWKNNHYYHPLQQVEIDCDLEP